MSPAIMFCDGERFAGLLRFAKLFYPLLGAFFKFEFYLEF